VNELIIENIEELEAIPEEGEEGGKEAEKEGGDKAKKEKKNAKKKKKKPKESDNFMGRMMGAEGKKTQLGRTLDSI
jgi:hypothetical protein